MTYVYCAAGNHWHDDADPDAPVLDASPDEPAPLAPDQLATLATAEAVRSAAVAESVGLANAALLPDDADAADPAPAPCSPGPELPASNAEQRVFGRNPVPQRVCQGSTAAGQPCRSFARSDSAFCQAHTPGRADALAQQRVAGGRASGRLRALRARSARLSSYEDLLAFTADVIRAAVDQDLPRDVARVVLGGVSLQWKLVDQDWRLKRHEMFEAQRLQREADLEAHRHPKDLLPLYRHYNRTKGVTLHEDEDDDL